MKSKTISTDFIRANTLRLLILALALMLLPHTMRLPLWVSIVIGGLLGWRLLALRLGWHMPNRWMLAGLTAAITAGLLIEYRSLLGREVGVAGLILMLTMKTLELRSLRDVMAIICLSFFLVITGFFYSQSMLMALYLLATVVLMTATLVDLNRQVLPTTSQSLTRTWMNNIKMSGQILLQAAPLMIAFFFLFPRISGPLWALPEDAKSAKSGLSDSMSPGTINQLILSNDIAFRARFESNPPTSVNRYWRGPVLWYTDGRTWYRNHSETSPQLLEKPEYQLAQGLTRYQISLEPHNKRWMFALDMPATIPKEALLTVDYQLLSINDITERRRYHVSSYTSYNTGPLGSYERRRALQLPTGQHPRTRELARQWRQERNNEQIVQKALLHFRNEHFVYTLLPRLLQGDTIDQFLFDTREGFCEHYASAFVTLMRAAGVPARVVTGYLGGEMNQFGGYMIIYQSDAHAWAEVWLEEQGWVRIDPTAAIAPERVESRIDNASLRSGAVLYKADMFWLRDTWHTLRIGFDALNQYWSNWIIDYNPEKQASFLSWLGMKKLDYTQLGIMLMMTFAALMAIIALFMFARTPSETDPVVKAYRRFLRKLAHKDINRQPGEGPQDFMQRAIALLPQHKENITVISRLFISLRYSGNGSAQQMQELRKQVKAFKV